MNTVNISHTTRKECRDFLICAGFDCLLDSVLEKDAVMVVVLHNRNVYSHNETITRLQKLMEFLKILELEMEKKENAEKIENKKYIFCM